MGTTPAPGATSRRPRRVAGPRAESQSDESVRRAVKVTGEGASHGARGGRSPHYGIVMASVVAEAPARYHYPPTITHPP